MANDLSDLDHLSPASTDLVSQGDDKIRETRQKLKNWATPDLGNTNAEHYPEGPHSFAYGDGTPPGFAGLPAIGFENRIAFDAINGWILIDKGGTWQAIRHANPAVNYSSSVVALLSGFQTIVSITRAIPSGPAVSVFWSLVHTTTDAGRQLSVDCTVNGSSVSLLPPAYAGAPSVAGSFNVTHNGLFRWSGALTVGTNTFALRAAQSSGTGSVTQALIIVLAA